MAVDNLVRHAVERSCLATLDPEVPDDLPRLVERCYAVVEDFDRQVPTDDLDAWICADDAEFLEPDYVAAARLVILAVERPEEYRWRVTREINVRASDDYSQMQRENVARLADFR